MAKLGKRMAAAREEFAGKVDLSIKDAVALVKKNANAKFDETVDISINLGVDPRHADQMVRGTVNLPNGTGKSVRVGVFARGAKAEEATAAGADVVGAEDFGQDLAKIDPAMLQGQKIILNLGEYNSQLLMALTWYHMRNRYQGILGDAKLIVPPSESMASMDDNKHTMRVKTNIMNLEDARFICRSLLARGFTCGVELLPDDFFAEISVSAMNTPEKS